MEVPQRDKVQGGYLHPTNETELINRLDECIGLEEEKYLLDMIDKDILKAEEEDLMQRILENIQEHERREAASRETGTATNNNEVPPRPPPIQPQPQRPRISYVTHLETPAENNNDHPKDSNINWVGYDSSMTRRRRQEQQQQKQHQERIPLLSDVIAAPQVKLVQKLPKYLDKTKTKLFSRGDFYTFVLANWNEKMQNQCPDHYQLNARLLEDCHETNDANSYSLIVTGPSKVLQKSFPVYERLLNSLKDTTEKWIRSRIRAYNTRMLLGDGESLLFDIVIPAKSTVGVVLLKDNVVESGTERKFLPDDGVWVQKVLQNKGISKALGSFEAFTRGCAIVSINGQSCKHREETRQRAAQHKEANKKGTITVCLSKYANLSGIDLKKHPPRRRDLKPFDVQYYDGHKRYRTPIKALPIAPAVSARDKQTYSKMLIADKNSIEIKITLPLKDKMSGLGVKWTQTSNGLWLSNFTKGKQFHKILGSDVSRWGCLLTTANGVSFKAPCRCTFEGFVADVGEFLDTVRATIIVFDGTDLTEVDKSRLVQDGHSHNPKRVGGELYWFEDGVYEEEETGESELAEDEGGIGAAKDEEEEPLINLKRKKVKNKTKRIEDDEDVKERAKKKMTVSKRACIREESSSDNDSDIPPPPKRRRLRAQSDLLGGQLQLRRPSKIDKLANYERFKKKYRPFVDSEYHTSDIKVHRILSSMWTQHKEMYGEEHLCDGACKCWKKLKQLSKTVVEDYKEKEKKNIGSTQTAGIADRFAPRFLWLLNKEYPNLTSSALIQRMVEMWQLHRKNPTLGIYCTDNCKCHEEWEDYFCKGDIEKIKAKKTTTGCKKACPPSRQKKLDTVTPGSKDSGMGQSSATTFSASANMSSVPRKSNHASERNARANKKAYEIIFDTHAPLGAYFVTENGKCKVHSIYKSGQFKKDPRLAVGTIVAKAVIGAYGADYHSINDHNGLRDRYEEADKKPTKKLKLVFINTEVASSHQRINLALPQSEWTSIGHWQGKIRHGWAGGAPCRGSGPISRLKPPPHGTGTTRSQPANLPVGSQLPNSLTISRGVHVNPSSASIAGFKRPHSATASDSTSSWREEEITTVTSSAEPRHREIRCSSLKSSLTRSKFSQNPYNSEQRKIQRKFLQFKADATEERFFFWYEKPMRWVTKTSAILEKDRPRETVDLPRISVDNPVEAFQKAVKDGTCKDLIEVLEAGCACDRDVAFRRLQEQYDIVKNDLHSVKSRLSENLIDRKLKARENDLVNKKAILSIYIQSFFAIEDAVSLHSRAGLEIRLKNLSIGQYQKSRSKRTEIVSGKLKLFTNHHDKDEEEEEEANAIKLGVIPPHPTAEKTEFDNDPRCVYIASNCSSHKLETRFLKIEIFEGDEGKDLADPLRLAFFKIKLNDIEEVCPSKGTFANFSDTSNPKTSSRPKVGIHLTVRRCKTSTEKKGRIIRKISEIIENVHRFNNDQNQEQGSKPLLSANIQCFGNVSLLHAAIELRDVESVKKLLEFGANPFARSRSGSAKKLALDLRSIAEEKLEHKKEQIKVLGGDPDGLREQKEMFESLNKIVHLLQTTKIAIHAPQKYLFLEDQSLQRHTKLLADPSETKVADTRKPPRVAATAQKSGQPNAQNWSSQLQETHDDRRFNQQSRSSDSSQLSNRWIPRRPRRPSVDSHSKNLPRRSSLDSQSSDASERTPYNASIAIEGGVRNTAAPPRSVGQTRRGSFNSERWDSSQLSHREVSRRSSWRSGDSNHNRDRISSFASARNPHALPDMERDWMPTRDLRRCTEGGKCWWDRRRGECRFWHVESPIPSSVRLEDHFGRYDLDQNDVSIKKRSGWFTAAYTDWKRRKIIYVQGGRRSRISHQGVHWYETEFEAMQALETVVAFLANNRFTR